MNLSANESFIIVFTDIYNSNQSKNKGNHFGTASMNNHRRFKFNSDIVRIQSSLSFR